MINGVHSLLAFLPGLALLNQLEPLQPLPAEQAVCSSLGEASGHGPSCRGTSWE